MLSKESTRAAPAGIRRDPQDDRLVGAINTASSTSVETAATAAHPNGGWWGSGAARVGDMTPQITLIKKCGPNPLMSKKIFQHSSQTPPAHRECARQRYVHTIRKTLCLDSHDHPTGPLVATLDMLTKGEGAS
jgi:hypothetical protein